MIGCRAKAAIAISVAGLLVLYVTSVIVSYIVGAIHGNLEIYGNRFTEERRDMMPILRSDARFSDIHIESTSMGVAYLSGTVPSREAYAVLQEYVEREFGQRDLSTRIYLVKVKEADAQPASH